MENNNIINDWLDKNGDPEIENLIKEMLADFNRLKDNNKLRHWVFFKNVCLKYYQMGSNNKEK